MTDKYKTLVKFLTITEEQAIDVGVELRNCKLFRWLPGMRRVSIGDPFGENGFSIKLGLPESAQKSMYDWYSWKHIEQPSDIPLTTDPATVGAIAYLVAEAWDGVANVRISEHSGTVEVIALPHVAKHLPVDKRRQSWTAQFMVFGLSKALLDAQWFRES